MYYVYEAKEEYIYFCLKLRKRDVITSVEKHEDQNFYDKEITISKNI